MGVTQVALGSIVFIWGICLSKNVAKSHQEKFLLPEVLNEDRATT